jgi:LmbE family N-acetylglucosaminyl deacetylase
MLGGEVQQEWRPRAVYHYIQDHYLDPDIVVDITPFFDKKMECIRAFSSQFFNPASKEPETPISTSDFMEFLSSRALHFGRSIGVRYGEGFTVKRPAGTKDLLSLI